MEPAAAVGDTPLFTVRRFWEKPRPRRPRTATELFRRGCLWNSFVMVDHISTFSNLFLIALPQLYSSFRKICPMFGPTSGQKAQKAVDQL
jgi:mannose-1-phosphate guanylyltransferase